MSDAFRLILVDLILIPRTNSALRCGKRPNSSTTGKRTGHISCQVLHTSRSLQNSLTDAMGKASTSPMRPEISEEKCLGVRSLRSRRRNVRGVTLDEMTRRVSAMVGAEVRGQESFEEAGRAGERDPGGGRSYGHKPGRGGCNPRQGGRTFCWRMRSRRPYGTIHRLLPCLRR